jgi:hypothetical protein
MKSHALWFDEALAVLAAAVERREAARAHVVSGLTWPAA